MFATAYEKAISKADQAIGRKPPRFQAAQTPVRQNRHTAESPLFSRARLVRVPRMNRKFAILALAASLLTHTARAASDATADASKKLIAAMRTEAQQSQKKGRNGKDAENPKLAELQALDALADDSPEKSQRAIALSASVFTSEPVRSAAQTLRTSLAEDDRLNAERAEVAKAEDLLKRTVETAKDAKNPADLDEVLTALQHAQHSDLSMSSSPQTGLLYQKMHDALTFVEKWQDYLSARIGGDKAAARRILEELLKHSNDAPFVTRSQLLALQRELSDTSHNPADLVLGIKSLEEMREVIMQLRPITTQMQMPGPGDSSHSMEAGDLLSSLSRLETPYREHLAGLPVQIEPLLTADGYEGDALGKLSELRAMLLKQVLPETLHLPKDSAPRDEETVSAFLSRVIGEAKEHDDLALAIQARNLRSSMAGGQPSARPDEVMLSAWQTGQSQEEAGQYFLAVDSYQKTLASGSDMTPAKTIGARLNAIREEHAEDYARAMERYAPSPVQEQPAPSEPAPPQQSRQPTPPPTQRTESRETQQPDTPEETPAEPEKPATDPGKDGEP